MIVTKTPFRVSFFCGGSDMPAFYTREEGAALSVCIDKFVYVCVHETANPAIRVMFDTVQELDDLSLIDHRITKTALEYANIRKGITVTSISDITRRGSGLGSSSAFTAGLLLALAQTHTKFGQNWKSQFDEHPRHLADLACEIEIDRSGYHIGKQDQYAVAHGGMNLFRFNKSECVSRQIITLDPSAIKELESCLLLVYTGRTRQASDMLAKQTDAITHDERKFQLAKENKDRAWEAAKLLIAGEFDRFGHLLHDSWKAKKSILADMTQPAIDTIYTNAINAGALGGKLLGAGGGGFFVFYVTPDHRTKVQQAIEMDPLCQCYDFRICPTGSQVVLAS